MLLRCSRPPPARCAARISDVREPGLTHEVGKAVDTVSETDEFTMTGVNDSLPTNTKLTKQGDGASGCTGAGESVPMVAATAACCTPAAKETAGSARAPTTTRTRLQQLTAVYDGASGWAQQESAGEASAATIAVAAGRNTPAVAATAGDARAQVQLARGPAAMGKRAGGSAYAQPGTGGPQLPRQARRHRSGAAADYGATDAVPPAAAAAATPDTAAVACEEPGQPSRLARDQIYDPDRAKPLGAGKVKG